MPNINMRVLMSGADYFNDEFAINAHMNTRVAVSVAKAKAEHALIKECLEKAGVKVVKVDPPAGCQDGVYAANWALCRGTIAVMSSLPNKRKAEEAVAENYLRELGFKIVKVPDGLHFSGQGDALPIGNHLLTGSVYRTDVAVHRFLASTLGFEVISLQAKPLRGLFGRGRRIINKTTGWPDSYYYDIDLAIAVLQAPDVATGNPGLIAWCPEAFMKDSAAKIRDLPFDKLEVSLKEAKKAFACNLVSTGETVIMSAHAPRFQAALEARGLKTITPEISELGKGGGYIRCTSLTLDNA